MKLLLTSAGIRTDALASALGGLVGKPLGDISVAIINEAAAVESGDKNWLLNELVDLRRHVPGAVDFVNLLALSYEEVRQRLVFSDVIYVVGGNQDYLYHVYHKTGFARLLTEELLSSKVYVGSSAGSMVMGYRAATNLYQSIYGAANTYGVKRYLELVDFIINPHYESANFPRNNRATVMDMAARESKPICALRDNQAIVVNGEDISCVGGDNLRVEKKPLTLTTFHGQGLQPGIRYEDLPTLAYDDNQ